MMLKCTSVGDVVFKQGDEGELFYVLIR
eukprot:COSAG02_NODE_26168_length_639_cov_0.937037_1_plen_27_part_10